MQTVKVNAKINLSIKVVGVAANGYHYLDMVTMPAENIADKISVTPRKDKKITCEFKFMDNIRDRYNVPDEQNTAVKAARLLMKEYNLNGFDILIEKGIPFLAGLGGSSADAAGVILATCKLFHIDVKNNNILALAMKCGADVPMQLFGGVKRVRGFGEDIEIAESVNALHIIVAKGKGTVSTLECMRKIDEITGKVFAKNDDNSEFVRALQRNDIKSAACYMVNDLQAAAILLNPDITRTLELLKASGAINANLSGTGSACFGVYGTAEQKAAAFEFLKDKLELVIS